MADLQRSRNHSPVDSKEEEKPSPYPPGVKCRGRPPKNKTAAAKSKAQKMEAAFAFKRRSPRFTSVSDPSNQST